LSTQNPKFFDKSCGRDSGQDSGNLPRAQNGSPYYQQVIGATAQAPHSDQPNQNNQLDGIQLDGIQKDATNAYSRIAKKYQNLLKRLAQEGK